MPEIMLQTVLRNLDVDQPSPSPPPPPAVFIRPSSRGSGAPSRAGARAPREGEPLGPPVYHGSSAGRGEGQCV